MTAVADARVLPETLATTWERLHAGLARTEPVRGIGATGIRCSTSAELSDSEEGWPMQVKELGHLVLYVQDVKRSAAFYGQVLGWEAAFPRDAWASRPPPSRRAAPITSCSSSRWGRAPRHQPEGRRLGLYHFGLKVGDSDDELREAVAAAARRPGSPSSGPATTR